MITLQCDNQNGTINWRNRARIVVTLAILSGADKRTLRRIMGETEHTPEFETQVYKEWDLAKARLRRRNKKDN